MLADVIFFSIRDTVGGLIPILRMRPGYIVLPEVCRLGVDVNHTGRYGTALQIFTRYISRSKWVGRVCLEQYQCDGRYGQLDCALVVLPPA